jgi:hypothetical protein
MFDILLFLQIGRNIWMQFFLDILQIAFWAGTLVAAGWTLRKGLIELQDSRALRARELREKQAALALQFTNKFDADEDIQTILNVIDYEIFTVKLNGAEREVNTHFFIESLKPRNPKMEPDEFEFRAKFIVKLLNYFESFEHYIQAKLMIEEDVSIRIKYFVSRLAKNKELAMEFHRYMTDVGFTYAISFLGRFSDWRDDVLPAAKERDSFPEQGTEKQLDQPRE